MGIAPLNPGRIYCKVVTGGGQNTGMNFQILPCTITFPLYGSGSLSVITDAGRCIVNGIEEQKKQQCYTNRLEYP